MMVGSPRGEEEAEGCEMKISILEMTDTSARIVLEDTTPHFANALRRTLLADIPKMAIEDVELHLGPIRDEDGEEYESVTPLFDEILAHRLGLLPVPTDLELFVRRDECKDCGGEGCPNCTIMYSLNKKGPCMVYSRDLEPVGDPSLKIKDPNIPLVKLGEGQAILVYATAILGTGKEHAKWQVASGVGYKYFPTIEIDRKKCDLCGSCVDICPRGILSIGKKKLEIKDLENCNMCRECVEACTSGAITVESDPTKIIFQFETDGSLTAERALFYGLKLLEEEFADLDRKIRALK